MANERRKSQMNRGRLFYVKLKDDKGDPYKIIAGSIHNAGVRFVSDRSRQLLEDAVVQIWTRARYEKWLDPAEFQVYELLQEKRA